ncbi:MAG: hypothetical protein AB9873_07335 [Syntrophobacteraceae bacterium]
MKPSFPPEGGRQRNSRIRGRSAGVFSALSSKYFVASIALSPSVHHSLETIRTHVNRVFGAG